MIITNDEDTNATVRQHSVWQVLSKYKSVSVFSQTTTMPLAVCISHAHTGVTSPHCCCETLTTCNRPLVFPCVEFFAITGQTYGRMLDHCIPAIC